jgi:Flp pilus assembly protein TadD
LLTGLEHNQGCGALLMAIVVRLIRVWLGAGIVAALVAGCDTIHQGVAGLNSPPSPTVQDPNEVIYYPSDQPLKMGLEHFERGNFGIAERYFRDAVEKAPKDVTAWIGLAASYDRIGRFDLADKAYVSAIRLTGETVQILNNQGYSYMLRGDLAKARVAFLKASRLEPKNPIITNNLALLNSSQQFIQRPPEP